MQFNSKLNLKLNLNLVIPHSFSHSLAVTIIVMIVVIVIDVGAMVIVARISTFSPKLELRNLQLGLHEKLHPLQLQILRELHPLLLHLHHLLQLRALRMFIRLAKFQNRLRQFPHRASPALRLPSSFASFPRVRTHHPRPLPLETLRRKTVA